MWGYRQFTFVDIILNEKMPAWLSKEKCILRSRVVFPPTVERLQFWVMRISLRSSTYSFQRSPTAYSVTISSHTSGAGSTQHPHSKPCIPEAILPVSKINLLCWLRSSQWQCQPMLYNSTSKKEKAGIKISVIKRTNYVKIFYNTNDTENNQRLLRYSSLILKNIR